MTTHKW